MSPKNPKNPKNPPKRNLSTCTHVQVLASTHAHAHVLPITPRLWSLPTLAVGEVVYT
jgi:hypothetical protein